MLDSTFVATAASVDGHELTLMEERAKNTSDDWMEFGETKHALQSDVEMLSAPDILHRKLLEQMQVLCVIVQDVGTRMDWRFAEEGQKRQQENQSLCARIDEGLTKEESARQ